MSEIPRIINIEENIGKTVGKRKPPHPLDPTSHSIKRAKEWSQAFPPFMTPKGVYRFKTHEEAEQWKIRNTRRPKAKS
ncbi:MAG: hypothetical protein ACSHX7_03930 [Luteolibacter sp.]